MIAVEMPMSARIEKKDVKTVTMATVPYSSGVSSRARIIVMPSWTMTFEYFAAACIPNAESILGLRWLALIGQHHSTCIFDLRIQFIRMRAL